MVVKNIFKIFICILLFINFAASAQYTYPFQDPDLPIETRIDNIISLLTIDEKIECLSTDPSVPRLGIKGSKHCEGLHGLAQGGPSNWGKRNPAPTSIFPQAYGLAESWDVDVLKKVAGVEGYEVRYMFQNEKYNRSGLVVRAPNADLGRDPRWGRTEECFGEDPYLTSQLVVSFIKGLQGNHPKYWQSASLMKHFLANSNENGRDSTSSDFDERLWREYYSYPFWKGVTEGGSKAFMAAYNAYNGIPCTVHPMLKNITVNEWGQNGIICTDGGGLRLLVSAHKYYPDLETASLACLNAGINQFLDRYKEAVKSAYENGIISEELIDSAIRGSFRVMIMLGLLDPPELVPYSNIGIKDTIEPWLTEKHQSMVREVTQKTIVLLKNENNILPLDKNNISSIAVIGPRANKVLLDWYSGTPPYTISPLEGIKNKCSANTKIYVTKDSTIEEAKLVAKKAGYVIICVGNHPLCDDSLGWAECPTPSFGREAVDRKTLILEQEELIKEVYKVNPNIIVVLISSFPYAINWTNENIPAILHLTHSGQELGNALADVIFGDYNPAGRLVQTWPKSEGQLPDMMDYNIQNGRTYMYFCGKPLFPFGYGLSYTEFAYSSLKIDKEILKTDGQIKVSFNLTNSGNREGEEVVQLYVQHINSKISRPFIELKGFKRINLEAAETKTIEFKLKAQDLAYWSVEKQCFIVEEDSVNIMAGASSDDIRLAKTIVIIK